jgi:hypothetical protein
MGIEKRPEDPNLKPNSELLSSVGKTSRKALISTEPKKIAEKLSVNSRGNRIYKNGIIIPKK